MPVVHVEMVLFTLLISLMLRPPNNLEDTGAMDESLVLSGGLFVARVRNVQGTRAMPLGHRHERLKRA